MKRFFSNLIRITVLIWFVAHFSLTLLYVLPVNPIKLAMLPLLEAYIGTYFVQNWSLFAPNPLDSNHALLVRCIYPEDHETIRRQGLPSAGWHDLSTPFWHRFQHNRFSAYDRLIRPQSNAIRNYANGGVMLADWGESCRKGMKESCDFFDEKVKLVREDSGQMFTKVGSAFCADASAPGQRPTHVALRMRQTFAVPWSRRYQDRPRVEDFELGVYPVDPNVARTGLYLVRNAS